jgi:hypothetical protein
MHSRRQNAEQVPPYEQALRQALDDLDDAENCAASLRKELAAAEARAAELLQLANGLVGMVLQDRRSPYMDELAQRRGAAQPNARAGATLNNVIELFRKDDEKRVWDAGEVQQALSGADPKAVYNAISYLERSGRLKRISRGKYLITDLGLGIEIGGDDIEEKYGTGRDSD